MAVRSPKLPNLKVIGSSVDEVRAMLVLLAKRELLVGFPEDTSERKADEEGPTDITNASLGYIHDNGAPEQNIPARPFMIPGMEAAVPAATARLTAIAKAVLARQGVEAIEQGFEQLGLKVQASLRRKINEGIPPPLSEWTLRDRARRGRTGAMWELAWRAAGAPEGTELAKPLIDTGQMRNAVNYVVRDRKKRSK